MRTPPSLPRAPFRATAPRLVRAALVALALLAPACRRKTPAAATIAPTPTPASATRAPSRADDAGYDLRPAEKAAVDEFLRHRPELRPAVDGDHREGSESSGFGPLYGIYHPYFVRGDANDDGLLDFVLAFVRRDSDRQAGWFSVVVFSGRPDGSFSAGGFLEREISLADGDLSLDRDAIVVTPDVGEDLSRRYRWDPAKQRHVFVRDDESEEPASTPPSQI